MTAGTISATASTSPTGCRSGPATSGCERLGQRSPDRPGHPCEDEVLGQRGVRRAVRCLRERCLAPREAGPGPPRHDDAPRAIVRIQVAVDHRSRAKQAAPFGWRATRTPSHESTSQRHRHREAHRIFGPQLSEGVSAQPMLTASWSSVRNATASAAVDGPSVRVLPGSCRRSRSSSRRVNSHLVSSGSMP